MDKDERRFKKGNGDGARSKTTTDPTHHDSTRTKPRPFNFSNSTTAFSSPFYNGPTCFGGSSANNRSLSHLDFTKNWHGDVFKFKGNSMDTPGPVGSGQEIRQVDNTSHLETKAERLLKRRRLLAVSKHSKVKVQHQNKMSLKTSKRYRLEPIEEKEEPEELPQDRSKNWSNIEPKACRFIFVEPIPLAQFILKRNYIFSPPTPLKNLLIIEPKGHSFLFTEPKPLAQFILKRNYIFSSPILLK